MIRNREQKRERKTRLETRGFHCRSVPIRFLFKLQIVTGLKIKSISPFKTMKNNWDFVCDEV